MKLDANYSQAGTKDQSQFSTPFYAASRVEGYSFLFNRKETRYDKQATGKRISLLNSPAETTDTVDVVVSRGCLGLLEKWSCLDFIWSKMWRAPFEKGHLFIVKHSTAPAKKGMRGSGAIIAETKKSSSVSLSQSIALVTNVKEIREKTGLNQKDFAEAFGIPLATLQNWEQGHRKPDVAVCVLLHLIGSDPLGVAEEVKKMKLAAIA